MRGYGRRLSTLILIGLASGLWITPSIASTCSDRALQTFTVHGVDAAFDHFHALLEESKCREEPAFWVNLAQAYKSKSTIALNSCRAQLAYIEALRSEELLPAYARVARRGVEQTKLDCNRIRESIDPEGVQYQDLLRATSSNVKRGAYHLALREYILLIGLAPQDQRPVRGLCKTARQASDDSMLQRCLDLQAQSRQRNDAGSSDALSGMTVGAWTLTLSTFVAGGLGVWSGFEMFEAYDDAVAAHHDTELALATNDRIRFDEAARREQESGKQMKDAEQRMIVYGAITGVLGLAAFTLWQFTDDTSVTMSDQGLIHLHATF